ncbi:MAG: glycosyltransferase family 2 protein [Polyangiaceae bacterium]|nr:glycosyltransferase family 2 protein [Polyangiaceae bacterium]
MRTVALVPAYQAAASVARVVTELRESWWARDPNVIVVDDGSTDATSDQARAAGALVVRHSHNQGKGAALRSGLTKAWQLGADAAVVVDADGQHPAAEALRLALDPSPLSTLVLGVRQLEDAGAPCAHRFSNGLSNFFLSAFTGRRLLDTQCGLRRYPVRETLGLGVESPGYAFEAEILIRACRAGWSIRQVPVTVVYSDESRAGSHFRPVRDPARIVARVLKTVATASRR